MSLKSKTWCALGMAAGFGLAGLIPAQAGVISAGHNGSFGLQADGSLWAWGYNGDRSYVSDYTNHSVIMQEANQLGFNIMRSVINHGASYESLFSGIQQARRHKSARLRDGSAYMHHPDRPTIQPTRLSPTWRRAITLLDCRATARSGPGAMMAIPPK